MSANKSMNQVVRNYVAAQDSNLMNEVQKQIISDTIKCRFGGFALELVDMFCKPAIFSGMSFEERLCRCLERQQKVMETSRFERMYRESKLPGKIYMNTIRPEPERGITQELLLKLINAGYLDVTATNGCTNIIFSGNSGVGKTTLAVATATEALLKGFSVMYFSMNELAAMLELKDKIDFIKFRDKLENINLLICDDYGQEMLSDPVIIRLKEIADKRYGKGSTIFTTHLKQDALGTVSRESPVLSAMLNRLFRPSDMYVTITGESWRGSPNELNRAKDNSNGQN